jgi:hypothetical protein
MIEDITTRYEVFFKSKMDREVGSLRKICGYKKGKYLSFDTITVLDYAVWRETNKEKWSRDYPVWIVKKIR